jgi:septal ring factor EnvC (AmiA/AmiB activator)
MPVVDVGQLQELLVRARAICELARVVTHYEVAEALRQAAEELRQENKAAAEILRQVTQAQAQLLADIQRTVQMLHQIAHQLNASEDQRYWTPYRPPYEARASLMSR